MSLNVNSVKTVFSKINSKGASLLRKDTSLDIAKAVKEGLKAPEGAKTFDAVRVGRKFNPGESYTDIFTFRDSNGNILKRITKKVDGKNIKETTKGFEELVPWEVDLVEDGSKVMDIFGKKVRSHTRENGKLTQITEDVFSLTDEAKPFLTHSRKEIKPNYESFLLEERKNGQPARFIKNDYETNNFYNGDFRLIDSKVSSPELKEIAQNNYLLPYVSTKNKFPYRMAQANIQDGNFLADPTVNLYKKASTTGGYCSVDDVYINLKSSQDLDLPRETLTNTIGHEIGHAKWNERQMIRDLYQTGLDDYYIKNYKPAERIKIKKYADAEKTAVSPKQNYKKYYENYREVLAREEGDKSVRKYFNFEQKLQEKFPFLHGLQFYPPSYHEDDIAGFMTYINSFAK